MPLAALGAQRVLRWLDLGHLSASALHQSYLALAALRRAEDPPWLLLASADAHLSLGAAQTAAAELDFAACAAVPVLQRSLGGGLVWVEPGHLNYFFLATPGAEARRPEQLLALLAPTIQAIHTQFGLDVELCAEQEFRWRGKRIASTGAASISESLVLAGSFLVQGGWEKFYSAVAAPSEGFRQTLGRALAASLCTWAEAGVRAPSHAELHEAWRRQLRDAGWHPELDALSVREKEAIAAQELEAVDWDLQGKRRVRDGIKLRADAFLTERHWPEGWLRVWTEDGKLRELASDVFPEELCFALAGLPADSPLWPELLAGYLGREGPLWQERLQNLAVWTD